MAPTPGEALQRLLEGNRRFVAGTARDGQEGASWRNRLAAPQQPFATILGCSDSRVPVELLFDQGFGDLFVVRVAGNVLAPDGVGSIEFAVHHLETPLVIVLGHEGCGAVTAALEPVEERAREPEKLRQLLERIVPALKEIDPTLTTAERIHRGVEANVRRSVRRLQEEVRLRTKESEAALQIVGAVYDLETGKVRLLSECSPLHDQ